MAGDSSRKRKLAAVGAMQSGSAKREFLSPVAGALV